MNEEELYENVKKLYKQYPNLILKPSVWKRMRQQEIKKEKNS